MSKLRYNKPKSGLTNLRAPEEIALDKHIPFGVTMKSSLLSKLDEYSQDTTRSAAIAYIVEKYFNDEEEKENGSSVKRTGKDHHPARGDLI